MKSANQTASAAASSAPLIAQATRSLRTSASTAAWASARCLFACWASAASIASRLSSASTSIIGESASSRCGKSRWASTNVFGGRSSIEKVAEPSAPRRTTPLSGPCPHARTCPAVAPAGSVTTARTRFIGTSQPRPTSCQDSSAVSAKRWAAPGARQWKENEAGRSLRAAKASMRTDGPPGELQSVVTR